MRLDRFSFKNSGQCYVELASEEQAQQAAQSLNNTEFMQRPANVRPLKPNFIWGSVYKPHRPSKMRLFDPDELSFIDALAPLIEERRIRVMVQPPGWWSPASAVTYTKASVAVIEKVFGKFGIEAISELYRQRKKLGDTPRTLCIIDFTTKAGADQAVEEFHNTEIQGRLVHLYRFELRASIAQQIGETDPALLTMLQEKGLIMEDELTIKDALCAVRSTTG